MSIQSGDERRRFDVGTGLIGVGALAAILGAFLPWLTITGDLGDGRSANGFDMISDAVFPLFSPILTIGLAVVAVVLTLGVPDNDLARIGEVVAGVVIALIAVIFVVSPGSVFGGGVEGELVGAFTDPGIGIMVTLAAGVAIAAGGVVKLAG
ncbi:hypothetical protein [Halorhabdus amylolytica]|uniref:hypothetical protein n=1 Tax=Halorhabdus amylolytica TaxID=2559573 RepID=UPI0010AABBD0|nr:hypothetical protein [Halorhabdus amylolytica]